jgi:hypothetical protein
MHAHDDVILRCAAELFDFFLLQLGMHGSERLEKSFIWVHNLAERYGELHVIMEQ